MGHSGSRPAAGFALEGALAFPSAAAGSVWRVDPQHTAAQTAVKHLQAAR